MDRKGQISFFSVRRIAYLAVLAAISVALNAYALPLADSTVQLSFTYIPSTIAGIFLGPISGFLAGVIGDGLGCIVAPKGPWIPLITLSSGLIGLIPGLLFRLKKADPKILLTLSFVLIFFICTCGLNLYGLYITYAIGKKTFWVYLAGRVPLQAVIVVINFIIMMFLYPALQKTVFKKNPFVKI